MDGRGERNFYGRALKRRRELLELTQEDVAKRSGETRDYVSKVEIGMVLRPSPDKLAALAKAVETTPGEIRTEARTLAALANRPAEGWLRRGTPPKDQVTGADEVLLALQRLVPLLTERDRVHLLTHVEWMLKLDEE